MATFFKNDETGKFLAAVDADMVAPAGYTEVAANSVDAATEKHVPVIDLQRDGHVLNVTVGEVEHPMEPEHYIEWIALETAGRLEIHYLKPGQAPTTFFAGGAKTGIAYAYCNLHGLWKAEF